MKEKEDLYTSSRSVVVSIGSLLLLGCTCATQSRFEAQAPALDLVQVDLAPRSMMLRRSACVQTALEYWRDY